MAKGTNKQLTSASSRQICQTRLHDDANLEIRYEILNKLGEGSFGMVTRVRNKENNLFYAMKTISKKPGNKFKASILNNEVKLLTEMNHPNLIRLHEVFESSSNLYLIVELCEGGELGGYVQKNGPLPEETVKQIMSKLINALHYLHKMNIVHRDLKLDNVLLKNIPINKTAEFDIRVTDFGLSSKKSITCTDSLFHDYCGTPLYMAPEILENKDYSALCDVWAMGIIMYYLICARHPYVASDERRLLEVIRSQKLRFDSEKFQSLSPEGLDFLQGMLVYDTVHRRTMGELTVHPWLTGRSDRKPVKDIITMMREFQAENDQHQTAVEKSLPVDSSTLTLPVNDQLTSMPSKQQISANQDSNQSKTNVNTSESPTIADRNKINTKAGNRLTCNTLTTPRRAAQDTHGSLANIHIRVKQNEKMSDLANPNPIRQTFNSSAAVLSPATVTKVRTGNVRRGRSQSYVDLHLPSKFSSFRQPSQQRPSVNSIIDSDNCSIEIPPSNGQSAAALTKMPVSATTTALMMINKEYIPHPSACLPPIINHHQQHTKSISFYQKRCSNHT